MQSLRENRGNANVNITQYKNTAKTINASRPGKEKQVNKYV